MSWLSNLIGNLTGIRLPAIYNPITGNYDTIQGQNGAVNVSPASAQVLNIASAAITATTPSADLSVGNFKELAIDVNISAVAGTTPTYILTINRKGADGIYYPIYTGTAQTAAGKVSVSLGVGAETNKAFGNTIQIVETIGGTTPSFTRSVSIIGK